MSLSVLSFIWRTVSDEQALFESQAYLLEIFNWSHNFFPYKKHLGNFFSFIYDVVLLLKMDFNLPFYWHTTVHTKQINFKFFSRERLWDKQRLNATSISMSFVKRRFQMHKSTLRNTLPQFQIRVAFKLAN